MSRHAQANGKRWQALRAQALARDNRTCQKCGKRWGRLDVDHIVSVHQDGAQWDMSNLRVLCAWPCHVEKTRIENRTSGIVGRLEWQRRLDKWR